jgi:hypothetical protein
MRSLRALAAVLSLAACGDDDVTGTIDAAAPDAALDAAPPAPTLADVCGAGGGLYVAYVDTLFSCFPEYVLLAGPLPAAAEMERACTETLQPYLDDGTIALGDAADFDACRAYLDAIDCDGMNDLSTTPCDALLVGMLGLNAACDSHDQCAGAAWCDRSDGGCGTCRAKKSNDTTCREDVECVSGWCDPASGTCRTRSGEGQPCTTKDDCGGTRVCSPTTSTCIDEPAWVIGTPCRDFGDCDVTESGLYCDESTRSCRPFLPLDATCGDETAHCNFARYEHCVEGVCVGPTTVAEGDACDFLLGTQCAAGLLCRDAVCLRLRALGEACDEAAPCGTFLECVGGVCQYGGYTGACPAP